MAASAARVLFGPALKRGTTICRLLVGDVQWSGAGHAGRDRGLSHFDAYVLFGSLDNRGTPSTAIDLTKNLIMAQAESNNLTIDDRFRPLADVARQAIRLWSVGNARRDIVRKELYCRIVTSISFRILHDPENRCTENTVTKRKYMKNI